MRPQCATRPFRVNHPKALGRPAIPQNARQSTEYGPIECQAMYWHRRPNRVPGNLSEGHSSPYPPTARDAFPFSTRHHDSPSPPSDYLALYRAACAVRPWVRARRGGEGVPRRLRSARSRNRAEYRLQAAGRPATQITWHSVPDPRFLPVFFLFSCFSRFAPSLSSISASSAGDTLPGASSKRVFDSRGPATCPKKPVSTAEYPA